MTAAGHYITEDMVDNWPSAVSATDAFNPSDVSVADNKITVAVDIATGSLIQFTSTQVLPAPLIYGASYYAIRVDATHIKAATTSVLAAAGTPIDLTTQGTGVHTVNVGEGSSTADRQDVIDRAEQTIERATRDYFYTKAFMVTLDGNGQDRIYLGLRGNIISVTEVKLSGVVLSSSYWTYDEEFIYLNPLVVDEDAGNLAELHYRLKDKESLFPEGQGNIAVTGTHGWSSTPPAVKKAAIILCKAENDSTLYQTYTPVFNSENVSGYSYSRTQDKYLTGVIEADRLITLYVRKKPMMGAI